MPTVCLLLLTLQLIALCPALLRDTVTDSNVHRHIYAMPPHATHDFVTYPCIQHANMRLVQDFRQSALEAFSFPGCWTSSHVGQQPLMTSEG